MAYEKTLRVGVIGADAKASWAKFSHVPALAAVDGLELAAVATRSQDSADEAAKAFGAPHAFGDPLDLIHSEDVDIVTVAVRVPAHRDLVLAALAAGKPVYCESPLGRSVAEGEEMTRAALASGARTAIGLQSRYNPALRRATELVASGAIGQPLTARIISTSQGFGAAFPAAYDYFNKANAGADLSTITAAHTLDAVETVLGRIGEVNARSAILFPEVQLVDTGQTSRRETADQLTVLGRLTEGCEFVADINGGIAADDAAFTFEIRGSDGWVTLTGGAVFGFQGGDLELSASVPFAAPARPVVGEDTPASAINVGEAYAHFARDLREGTDDTAGFAHGLRISRLIATVSEAARTGARQAVVA